MIILPLAAVLLAVYYFFFLLRVQRGLKRLRVPEPRSDSPLVTVVVAARNEEESIAACLDSLVAQEYPKDRYEILIVDDGSSDRTAEIVRSISQNHRHVRLLSIPEDSTGSGKPKAIAMGIKESTGEIIMTTDADCVAPPGWIRGMVACFGKTTSLVAGPVIEAGGIGLISELSRIEFLGLVSTAAGLIGSRTPNICNGANLAYTKSAFQAAGGFGENDNFCDDETLMQRIHFRRIGSIGFSANPETTVTTASPGSFRHFWEQRIRWASKRGHYENFGTMASLILLYLYFVTLLLFSIASLAGGATTLLLLVLLLGVKIVQEYVVLRTGASLLKQSLSMSYFLIAEIFHVPYIVVAAVLGQFGSLNWKGRAVPR